MATGLFQITPRFHQLDCILALFAEMPPFVFAVITQRSKSIPLVVPAKTTPHVLFELCILRKATFDAPFKNTPYRPPVRHRLSISMFPDPLTSNTSTPAPLLRKTEPLELPKIHNGIPTLPRSNIVKAVVALVT